MVSYYNPMAMYRSQGTQPGQFHNGGSTPSWYNSYHHHQATQQQYLSCMQDSEAQQVPWHHSHPGHSVFNHEFFDYNAYIHQQQQEQPLPQLQLKQDAEPQLPSPPMSSSELSSPGAPGGGSVTPPKYGNRPGPVRSPYDWMNKPSYQSQPNPGKTRTKDKYRVVYTDHQRLELEKEFHFARYITIRRKAELAANLGLSERQVKIWFQNRRAKERKQVKKREELNSKDLLSNLAMHQLHQQSMLQHQPQQPHHTQLTGVGNVPNVPSVVPPLM